MEAEKILLVDDEAGIRKVLGISLRDMGFEVHAAADGEKALEIFKKIRPPIVLTDIRMPGMDGVELLRRIKKMAPKTEVIMITGHGDTEVAIKSLKFEATDFVTKPINDDALEIALARARERIEMREKLKAYTNNLEALVAEKTRDLLAAERMAAVGQTVTGLAHAIKNIAGGLKGGAFVLEKGIELKDEKYLEQGWQMVSGNVEKIAAMSLDLLNYAKQDDIDLEPCDPNRPVEEVVELMLPKAAENGISLLADLDRSLPALACDADLLHRALLNLVTNAIDACRQTGPQKGPKEVLVKTGPAADGGVKFEVTDTGCGMSAEVEQQIFKRFFSTKGSNGTGIGLMLTQKIVHQHNGTISMKRPERGGCCFTIVIPAQIGSQQIRIKTV